MPKAEATIKGHLTNIRKNKRSKITNKKIGDQRTNTDKIQEHNNSKTDLVMATVDESHKIYTEQTGKFPMTSSGGNKYVLIMYVYNTNTILAELLNSRSVSHILEAYTKKVKHLKNRGYIPRVHFMDNKASSILRNYNHQKDTGYPLVLPHVYHVNSADRAIRTWKYRFIAGLAIIDTRFTTNIWCQLIPQATTTLNMLIPCRQNPTMLEYTVIGGYLTSTKHP